MNLSILNFKNSKLKKTLFSSILLVFFLFIFDRVLFFSYLNIEGVFYGKNSFEKHFKDEFSDKKYDTLLFGTSRTYEGIHPIYLKQTLGINVLKDASVGKGPKNNYYFYKLYKKHFGIPKTVIYGIDYFIYTINSNTQWMSRFGEIPLEKNKYGFFSELSFLFKYKYDIDMFINTFLLSLDTNNVNESPIKNLKKIQSYTGNPHTPEKLITKEPSSKYHHQWFPRFPGKEGRYLRKLLDELQKDKVLVIFVFLPDYYGTYKTNFQQKRFLLHFRRFRADYNNLYIYNFNRKSLFPLNEPKYFLDGGWGKSNCHLSDEGAKVFSKVLSLKLKKHFK